jgi:guanosine-3',5'-bis(diphosphate) 3'-pyrophosphohydrolase
VAKAPRYLRQYELIDRVKAYDPTADEDLLNRAYVYATRMHGSQLRASGDPYFAHPIEVAGILTEYRMDTAAIVTALLHDVIEDTGATRADVAELFGDEIAELVEGVTKLSKLELTAEHARQAENLRKFILAISKDVRVLIVKLADRLHNMRTLSFLRPEKRERIARETLDIYARLARTIGMHKITTELEELAFEHLNPTARNAVVRRLESLRAAQGPAVALVAREVVSALAESGVAAEAALLDLAQAAAQVRRLLPAFRHLRLPRRGGGRGRLLPRARRRAPPVVHGAGAVQGLHFHTKAQ